MSFQVSLPVNVSFGRNEVSRLGKLCRELGKRALLVTMKDLVELGLVDRALVSLKDAGIDCHVCDRILPDPEAHQIDGLRDEILDAGADMIIGLGGGSCLDAAKAVAILATNPSPIWDYVDLRYRPAQPIAHSPLPIVAIPTTSGTGSEVTANSVLVNAQTTEKATIKHPLIYPRIAVVDPDLTLSLPQDLTAMTGVDAFAHAFESFINSVRRSPFSDLVAQDAMKRIYQHLPRVVQEGGDETGREELSLGSLLAGIAIAHAGTTVTHALAQPATARLGLSHALAVAIFTPPVNHLTYKHDVDRFARIAHLLVPEEASGLSGDAQAELGVLTIDRFLESVGMKQTLSQNGAQEEVTELLVEDGIGYMGRGLLQHPVEFGKTEIRQIVQLAF